MSPYAFRYRLPALVAVLVLPLALGCRQDAPIELSRAFDGRAALQSIERQLAFGPRIPGTDGHQRMDGWLDSLLPTKADTVIVQRWRHVTAKGDTIPLANFLARFNPTAAKRLLFLAHWDTRPHADAPGSKTPDQPVPGANDGGSGVAVLLGVAEALHRQPAAAALGVDLLFVDGEDYGDFTKTPNDVLIGARYFAANLPSGPRPAYAVLFDMVGDKSLKIYQEGRSVTGAPEVVDQVWEIARRAGYGDIFIDQAKHTLTDDHVELQKVGLRAIDIIDFDYPAWHTTDDTIDKVSAESLEIVGQVALAIIQQEEGAPR